MSTTVTGNTSRVTVVDALRGFAIMSIMLLHNLEHFDFYYSPENLPLWIKAIDGYVWNTMFFLFSGKSYAIFALLFGFTFYIMDSKQQKLGVDFRGRFLWRMLLLLGFGTFNSLFYEGDILAIYAVLGVSLVLVNKLSNKAVLFISILLLLQPFELIRSLYIWLTPAYVGTEPASWHYFGLQSTYIPHSSFIHTAIGNLINGRIACTIWSWEAGRFFQAPALFMMGMLLGRKGLFLSSDNNKKLWKKALVFAAALFAILFVSQKLVPGLIEREELKTQFNMIIGTYTNFALMAVWVSLFILLYQINKVQKVLTKLEPFGKMSLTNYVMQSMLGACIYYGFGLGLYKYTGATYCLLIGIVLFVLQLQFCKWWLKSHKQGPLEALWHKWTWIKSKNE
jgi:uncharacterized protein